MKVYLVIEDWIDDDAAGNCVAVYDTLEKAQNILKEKASKIAEEFDYDTQEVYDTSAEFYNNGYYMTAHTAIRIEESEVL